MPNEEEKSGEDIAAEVYAEMDLAEKGTVKEPKDEPSTLKKDDEESGQPNDKSKDQADGDQDGTDDKGKDEDAGEDSDESGDKSADDKGKEQDLDKKITEYAEKHKLTYAEAKEDVEKTEEIIKQYKNDPAEMARAMRNKDREYHKLRTEAEKAVKKPEPVFVRMNEDQFRDYAQKVVAENPDYIEKYRAKYPARSESMSDEAIIEEIADREYPIYLEKANHKEMEIKGTAQKLRDDAIAKVPEADRRFIPSIKAELSKMDDNFVMSETFNIKYLINQAKGEAYDADIKAAEERALKRFKESPEIAGTKGGGSGRPQSSTKSSNLNSSQKETAKAMFGSDYEDEKCYEMFKDMYKDEIKKNSNFDPYRG